MKKIVFLFLLSLTSFSAKAQNSFKFGIQTSPVLTWMSTDDKNINGNGSNLGFKLGLMAEIDFTETYSLTSGVSLAFNQGGTLKYNNSGNYWTSVTDTTMAGGVNLKHSLKIVEIPFSLKMKTNEFGFLRYYAELPIVTIGIVTKSVGDVHASNLELVDEDISKEMRDLSLAWGFGVGAEYEVSSTTRIVGGISYQNYFLDFTKKSDADDSKAALNGLTFKLGILF